MGECSAHRQKKKLRLVTELERFQSLHGDGCLQIREVFSPQKIKDVLKLEKKKKNRDC